MENTFIVKLETEYHSFHAKLFVGEINPTCNTYFPHYKKHYQKYKDKLKMGKKKTEKRKTERERQCERQREGYIIGLVNKHVNVTLT